MTLKLVMIRCPDNVAPERREVRGGEFSIGRGQDNEWVIPDPERHLSKRHCRLVYSVGDWQLHDLSSNGTFLNRASEPVGKGASAKLRNGDRIKFGLYELEVMIDEDEEGAARDHEGSLSGLRRDDFAMRDAPPSRADLRHYDDPGHDARLPESAFGTGRVQFADPAGGLRSPGAQSGAVRRHATGPCARARKRLPPAPAGGHHSRRLGCRSACRLAPANGATAAAAAPASKTQPPRRHQGRSPPPRPPAAPDTGLAAAFLRGVGMSETTSAGSGESVRATGRRHAGNRQRPSANPDGARQHQG